VHSSRLKRVFDLMLYLAASPEGRVLSDVSEDLDIPVSSAHDLLRALTETDAVSVVNRRYVLGPLALRLGVQITDSVAIRRVARPHLRALVDRIGCDVYLAIRTGRRVIYVDRYRGTQSLNLDIRLGQRLYLHSTAVGKLYAAYEPDLRAQALTSELPRLTTNTITDPVRLERELDRISRRGVSLSREESYDGAIGMAVPVWDLRDSLCAAVHVSGLRGQLGADRRPAVAEEMKRTAAAIARDLGVEHPRRLAA
jgi:DNA-binding IclR family transcriptional regulator